MPLDDPRSFLRSLFDVAVRTADPMTCLPTALPAFPAAGKLIVLGAGKAAGRMAEAVEAAWPDRALDGLVVTRHGYGRPTSRIKVVEAAHPVPDAAGEAAARDILARAEAAGSDDTVLFLLSGGASALLALPAPGLSLADKQSVTRGLLRAGANIGEINAVRKHLSAIKGGRLAAAAAPARIVTLSISDVPGDDPSVIGSGPTVGDPSTLADARAVLDRWKIELPAAVAARLADPAAETPKPGAPIFDTADYCLIARPADALEAAGEAARAAGIAPLLLGDALEGEAREVARDHAALARTIQAGQHEVGPPAVILSGGELTVTIAGDGRGGPNREYALALAIALQGAAGIHAIAGDTDGVDGADDTAGALVDPETLRRAADAHLDPATALAANDSGGFFAALGDALITGPTFTNVNDFRAILVL